MAGSITINRIRVAVDSVLSRTGTLIDALTGKPLAMWQAEDVQVELGIFNNTVIVSDVTNFTSVTMEVKDPANLLGAPLITSTVLFASLQIISGANWTNGTAQNAVFLLTQIQTNIALLGAKSKDFQIWFWATTNDGTPRRIPLGTSPITLQDSGYGDVGSIQVLPPGARMTASRLQILNPDTNLYYDLCVRIKDGQPDASLEGAGVV